MYGITETTVHVSYLALDREVVISAAGSLVGCSLPDLRVYVLDERLSRFHRVCRESSTWPGQGWPGDI